MTETPDPQDPPAKTSKAKNLQYIYALLLVRFLRRRARFSLHSSDTAWATGVAATLADVETALEAVAVAMAAAAEVVTGSPWADSSSGVQSPSLSWPRTLTVLSSQATGQVLGPGGVYCRRGGQSVLGGVDQLMFRKTCPCLRDADIREYTRLHVDPVK